MTVPGYKEQDKTPSRWRSSFTLPTVSPRSDVLNIFTDALDESPNMIVERRRHIGAGELASLMAVRNTPPAVAAPLRPRANEIWPLLSHHTYGNRALFGGDQHTILPRALTLLLLHDGLVVADPLESVHQKLTGGDETEAIHALNITVEELAQIEPLISEGVLRFTSDRPSLTEPNRSAILSAMGLAPDLRVFTDFLEAAGSVPSIPGSLERMYAPQVRELYRCFGLTIATPASLAAAVRQVRELAAAVIEVSWQFSVASVDSSCDLAFVGRIERHLAQGLYEQGNKGALGPGEYAETLSLGRVPNLDPARLTVADALAIRRGDEFASFRQSVRSALDGLDVSRRVGKPEWSGRNAFEEAMREKSRELREAVRRASFGDHLKNGSLPTALGMLAELFVAPLGPVQSTGAVATVSLATVIWQWLNARREQNMRNAVSQRYFAMLGGM